MFTASVYLNGNAFLRDYYVRPIGSKEYAGFGCIGLQADCRQPVTRIRAYTVDGSSSCGENLLVRSLLMK